MDEFVFTILIVVLLVNLPEQHILKIGLNAPLDIFLGKMPKDEFSRPSAVNVSVFLYYYFYDHQNRPVYCGYCSGVNYSKSELDVANCDIFFSDGSELKNHYQNRHNCLPDNRKSRLHYLALL